MNINKFIISFLLFLSFPFATMALFPSPRRIDPSKLVQESKLNWPINMFDNCDDESVVSEDKLVERRIKFPGLKDDDNGLYGENINQYVGYFKLPRAHDARMFYYFFESRNNKADAPIIAWINGGLGWSSSVALFYENGPFKINPQNLSLSWNEYGWDQVSNMIYVDQPIGVGFSYTNDERDIRHSDDDTINDLYDFLQAFFRAHPQYANNGFYITGQSYAGHNNPALATRIIQGNRVREGILIKLKGIAIGNGLTNPTIQYQAYTDYALDAGLIQRSDYDRINKLFPLCEMAIKLCQTCEACLSSYWLCTNTLISGLLDVMDNVNFHDITKKCDGKFCYDFSSVERYLNQDSVKVALGVQGLDFVIRNDSVVKALLGEHMRNVEPIVPDLLNEGVKVLVYVGEYSFNLNYLGNFRWVNAMEWSGKKFFIMAPQVRFDVDGEKVGCTKSYGPLTFLKVFEAGDMVAMDQPKAALEMIKRWTRGSINLSSVAAYL